MMPACKHRLIAAFIFILVGFNCTWSEGKAPGVQRVGRIQDDRLAECSGIDISVANPGLLWAVNDSGNGPFLYAFDIDGLSRGRIRVAGARNRDWEGLATFSWRNRPMILIADFGDNKERHETHALYVVDEPVPKGDMFDESTVAEVAWRIVFSYPDRNHDAEAVVVDAAAGKILVLTKRDNPPLLFELPLKPVSAKSPILAEEIGSVGRIPPPSAGDLLHKYGFFRSQPTAMDLSDDGLFAVILTYKHAYLFKRNGQESWAAALSRSPVEMRLPLPQNRSDLRQREAICFSSDGEALFVTSEGEGAGIFRMLIDKARF